MPRTTSQKKKLFTLYQILYEYTDDNNGLTMAEILSKLQNRGITAERRSIYDDIEILRNDFDLDIEARKTTTTRYHLQSREFELSELKLLVDSVQASKFITEKKTYSLIKKLEKLCSKYEAQSIQGQVYLTNRIKSMNQSIYYNTGDIHKAITEGKQISFQYLTYTITKEEAFRRDGSRYTVSPFALIYTEENYYLLAYDGKAGKFKHFRVDRMKNIQISVNDREGIEQFKQIDMARYTTQTFSMFGGEAERLTLEFSNHLIGVVVDRFGKDIPIRKTDEEHFQVSVDVVVSEQFFGWLFGLGTGARIVSPQSAAERMRKSLEDVKNIYEVAESSQKI